MEAKEIANLAQIASVLEVSGWPKPGNVHRTRNYDDMVFQDFVISGVVIGDTMEEVASQAFFRQLMKPINGLKPILI